MTSEESIEAEEEEEGDVGGFFFVDKSIDDVEGFLPKGSGIFERDSEDDEDSDLEEQINLADELLAELDRGLLRKSDASEDENDEMKDEEKEDDNINGKDASIDEGEKMELSKASPLVDAGSGRSSKRQRTEDSQESTRKVKRRRSVQDGKNTVVNTPKVYASSGHEGDDDGAGEMVEEDNAREEESVENQDSRFLKEIRSEMKNVISNPEPKRSSPVCQAGTSSTEGSQTSQRKKVQQTRMTLRTRLALRL